MNIKKSRMFILISIIGISAILFFSVYGNNEELSEEYVTYSSIIERENVNIYVYGDELNLEEINYYKVNNLNDITKDTENTFLIIYLNRNSFIELNNESYSQINDLYLSENISIIFYGAHDYGEIYNRYTAFDPNTIEPGTTMVSLMYNNDKDERYVSLFSLENRDEVEFYDISVYKNILREIVNSLE